MAKYIAGEASAEEGDHGLGYSTPAAAKAAQDTAIVAAAQAGLTCDSDLRGNGDCDAECNNIAFNFDDGDCDPNGGCYQNKDCASCLSDQGRSCGWCGTSGQDDGSPYVAKLRWACSGRNELGVFTGTSLASCKSQCSNAATCVSLEYKATEQKCRKDSCSSILTPLDGLGPSDLVFLFSFLSFCLFPPSALS